MIKKYNNEKIDPLQYMVLVIFTLRSFYNGIGIQNILKISKYDTWISILLGIIIGFLPILIVMYLNKKNTNLFDILKSKIAKFIIMLFLCFSFITLLHDFISFSNLKYLFETSNLIIALLFILPSLYIVNKGIEKIGRSALFMFYISVFLFFIICISLIQFIDFNNLKPILKDGFIPILKSSIHFISYSLAPILFLSIIPKEEKNYKEYNKKILIGYIISSFSIFIIIFYITTVFNYQYASLFNYPTYFLFKKIEYKFLSNIENILSLFFIIDYFYTIFVYMYLIKYYLEKEFKIKDKLLNITYLFIIGIIVYISVFVYKNINVVHFVANKLLFYILLLFILLFVIFVPILIKKDNKNEDKL